MKTIIHYPSSPGASTSFESEGAGVRIVTLGPSGEGTSTWLSKDAALQHALALLAALRAAQ